MNDLINRLLTDEIEWLRNIGEKQSQQDCLSVIKSLEDSGKPSSIRLANTIFSGIPSLTWASKFIVYGMRSDPRSVAFLSLHVDERWLQTSTRHSEYPHLNRDSLMFLGFKQFERAEWLFPRLEPSNPLRCSWEAHRQLHYPLEFFCRCLWACYQGESLRSEDVSQCGVYAGIFMHWENPVGLEDAINTICDYHLSHAIEPKGYDIHEFHRAPFTLLPVEILALRTVREKLGLPMPEVEHPLLTTRLMKNLPRTLPEVHDVLLERVKAAVERLHQEFTNASQGLDHAEVTSPSAFSIEEQSEKTGIFRRT
jgi:hypothetical protein